MQDALLTITQSRTVPQVFIKGEFIGGCDGNSTIECSAMPDMCCPFSVLGMQCQDTGTCYECFCVQILWEPTAVVSLLKSSQQLGLMLTFKMREF